jgi:aminomethyltransferase
MSEPTKKTALFEWHTGRGANMANFGGYEMPLWYSSAKNEHLSVLERAGLFDTSHMAVVMLTGPGAHDLLQRCFSNDLDACVGPGKRPLVPGRCVYGAFLNENGEVIDDSIVNKIANEEFMVVVNAAMGSTIADHLKTEGRDAEVNITDLSDRLGKIDVQGPAAAKIIGKLIKSPESVFEKMPYFSFKGHFDPASVEANTVLLTDNTPILLSRTGYTGEFGFEIFVSPDRVVEAWEQIYAAGEEFGLTPCGLAARDSLRGGAVLPLSHQDIGHWPFVNHPWPFALPYAADGKGFTKSFIGDKALLASGSADYTHAFVGSDLRKVSISDPAVVIDPDDNEIGSVLTCVTDMGIGLHEGTIFSVASPDKPEGFKPRGLCCGFVKCSTPLTTGTVVQLKDQRRSIKVTIVEDVRPNRTARVPIKQML